MLCLLGLVLRLLRQVRLGSFTICLLSDIYHELHVSSLLEVAISVLIRSLTTFSSRAAKSLDSFADQIVGDLDSLTLSKSGF